MGYRIVSAPGTAFIEVDHDRQSYKFRYSEVAYYVGAYPIDKVVDILAANVQNPTSREDGSIAIEQSNFNDSFEDMITNLLSDDDWDDDEDDYDWEDDWNGED